MTLKLDAKQKFVARSDRVKCVDLHPSELWLLTSLYNGSIYVWNYESQLLVKSFKVCDLPVRAAKFVPRKNWIITGSDDFQVRVYNYNTLEQVHIHEAHADYIRSIVIHTTQPFILTSSDDMLIKLWDWEKEWICIQVFQGHVHYVMQIVINPKDINTFASASLDCTVKIWQLGSSSPNFTLEGHEKGVNCVDYYHGRDKPYLISGADDRLVKIWDYQSKTCIQTLKGHAHNISAVTFHPELPIIMTGSEDAILRIWHVNTYRLKQSLSCHLERVWTIACLKGSNRMAVGCDEGCIVIKLGRNEPALSMNSSGKIIWAKHFELQQVSIKAVTGADIKDRELLPLIVKDMGICEIYPQTISHNPNGRFVVVCGNGEYIIYTTKALRSKSFGTAEEFVWSFNSSVYAIRESGMSVKIFKEFKEKKVFKPEYAAEAIFGGHMLGVKSVSGLAFYDWESLALIRRIEIQPKHVFWSKSEEFICIATEDSFYVLKYNAEVVSKAKHFKIAIPEDGMEEAFTVLSMHMECVKTGLWIGDCFVYTNSVNHLCYYVGGQIVTISYLDKAMYLLGYIHKDSRLYLCDKELNIISYSLLLSVLEYQTAIMRGDFETAHSILPSIPWEQHTRVGHFLEKKGLKSEALVVSTDPDNKFELSLQLGNLRVAYELAKELMSEQKWKQLAELATLKCEFQLAEECLYHAKDYGGLLLLATSLGNTNVLEKLGQSCELHGIGNVAFISYFLLGKKEKALNVLMQTRQLPEAAFFACAYLPSHVSRVVKLWKEMLKKINEKASFVLADPDEYENLFPALKNAVKAEQFMKQNQIQLSAASYLYAVPNNERNPIDEMKEAESSHKFLYVGSLHSHSDQGGSANCFSELFMPSYKATENIPSEACSVITAECTNNVDQATTRAVNEAIVSEDMYGINENEIAIELDIQNLILNETIKNEVN